ncbi:MAG: response regulator transcription factor [Bdellovibrionales bacterium]
MRKVLLVEDSLVTQEVVKTALYDICELTIASDCAAALLLSEQSRYDLVLLDVNLPDGSGFEFYSKLKDMKTFSSTPILFLTARAETEDKVAGFALGADDYIVKPFDIVEFKARISAKLKNLVQLRTSQDEQTYGPFEVKLSIQRISRRDGEGLEIRLELTANQFKVLHYLLKNQDRVVTRKELLDEVWGEGVHVTNRTIDTHVYSIRQQLGEMASCLQSVHGKGYQFTLPLAGSQAA